MPQMSLKKSFGFTLIEVLVALAIISIALTAIIKATSQNIKNTIYLQNKTIAGWVGTQVINEATVGLLQLPVAPDKVDGEINMMNQTWAWQAQLVNSPNPRIKKIEVNVMLKSNGETLINLESFLYVAQ
jgi:general secretion pathway protein I